ncbi:uncharacterized protein G2W53_003528 [Senna tora]|uniref:Uncharacterized protein n=1 Tax=Senna tora TaxID=362788 RepID=A0A835CII2_9FABA|nr:uncharacterized protein G2W53_003528 [Senna tora]
MTPISHKISHLVAFSIHVVENDTPIPIAHTLNVANQVVVWMKNIRIMLHKRSIATLESASKITFVQPAFQASISPS